MMPETPDTVPRDAGQGEHGSLARREFLRDLLGACGAAAPVVWWGTVSVPAAVGQERRAGYDPTEHHYGMGIDVRKCIGCARCVVACKTENDVPEEPHFFNTWIERYVIRRDGEVEVDSPNGGIDGFPPIEDQATVRRTFFVPKLCNHCDNPPCVQVCPVGATFITQDGVVLVDDDYCIGCRYCRGMSHGRPDLR
jgi:ferredoxin